ncbi:MAG TPA: hypothetical protein PL117_01265 [Accumulibacter sp.]|uniref:hypothetical protein n=1 Tax=Accumulibacter sp. TaxID=2053492 RepID=UPI000ED8FB25|nr:hypothetical protein [Accumulibacter sp.]HCZ14581.1 hypothetical protein [Accumulibacter sp.]HRF71376.1 hypothetical protein [Accumulibacter sp.]
MSIDRALPGKARPSRVGRWLREPPLLRFRVAGGVLVAVHGALNPQAGASSSSSQVRLTRDDLRQLAMVRAVKWQRPPTPDEMHRLIENRVGDEGPIA